MIARMAKKTKTHADLTIVSACGFYVGRDGLCGIVVIVSLSAPMRVSEAPGAPEQRHILARGLSIA